MVPTSSPKLEDFLGVATMGAHDYGGQEREQVALSLDSIYYNTQNAHPEANRDHSLELLSSEHFRHVTLQSHPYYSGLGYHAMFQSPVEEENKEAHITVCSSQMAESLKNFVPQRECSTQHAVEQKMNCTV